MERVTTGPEMCSLRSNIRGLTLWGNIEFTKLIQPVQINKQVTVTNPERGDQYLFYVILPHRHDGQNTQAGPKKAFPGMFCSGRCWVRFLSSLFEEI